MLLDFNLYPFQGIIKFLAVNRNWHLPKGQILNLSMIKLNYKTFMEEDWNNDFQSLCYCSHLKSLSIKWILSLSNYKGKLSWKDIYIEQRQIFDWSESLCTPSYWPIIHSSSLFVIVVSCIVLQRGITSHHSPHLRVCNMMTVRGREEEDVLSWETMRREGMWEEKRLTYAEHYLWK